MPRERPVSTTYRAKGAARDTRLAELAARQHGVVALRQLEALGISPTAARSRSAAGRLHRVHSGVYAVGHPALGRHGHWMAAVLVCGPDAALSHASAAALWGIRDSAAARVDVTVPTRAGRRRPGLRIHGWRLGGDEITINQGIACTTVARTLLDLATVLDRRSLEQACERTEILQAFDLRAVALLLERHRGRRGVGRLRSVLGEFDSAVLLARSELEVRFIHLCRDADLPQPIVNGRLELAGVTLEVDFHWPAWRLVVETDGRDFHRSNRARANDARRDRALASVGWTVIRATWREVVDDPRPLTARLSALLAPGRT